MPANDHLRDSSLVNEEVKEILGTPPAWIGRAGNMVLLGVVGIFIVLAACVSYPERIYGRAVIVPAEEPVAVVLGSRDIVTELRVADGREVRAGEVLLFFEKNGLRDSIMAAVGGRVVLQRGGLDDHPLGADTLILSIVPHNETYSGTIYLTAAGAGKIQPGQEVEVYLEAYPGAEFGALTGTVLTRPGYKGHKELTISVKIHSGQTTYRKYPVITGPMEGYAEVVTANKKLITQLWPF